MNPVVCTTIIDNPCKAELYKILIIFLGKYNEILNQCTESSQFDRCNTPYLSYIGCISIRGRTCQYNLDLGKCIELSIIRDVTTCDDLQYVNPETC